VRILTDISSANEKKRNRFRIALVGPRAAEHISFLTKAGYRVVKAQEGADAASLFDHDADAFDALVVDFEPEGMPPESVLLFCRRTSPMAPVIALVPHSDESGFRRAYLAGARDVMPSPTGAQDLLEALDLALESRVLKSLLEEKGLTTQALPEEKDALENASKESPSTSARYRNERDEAKASLRLHEKTNQELYERLKEARDEKRKIEVRAAKAENALNDLRIASGKPPVDSEDDGEEWTENLPSLQNAKKLQQKGASDTGQRDLSSSSLHGEALFAAKETQKSDGLAEIKAQGPLLEESKENTKKMRHVHTEDLSPEFLQVMQERDALVHQIAELQSALKKAQEVARPVPMPLALGKVAGATAKSERGEQGLEASVEEIVKLKTKLKNSEEKQALFEKDLEETLRARDHLRKHLSKIEIELADALEKAEELSGLPQEMEILKGNLQTERTARSKLKRRLAALDIHRRRTKLGKKSRKNSEEFEVQKRRLILAIATSDALSAELNDVRTELANARAMLSANLSIDRAQGE